MKNKFISKKKLILYILIGFLSLGIFIAILTIRLSNPFKPSFYTYSSYVDPKTKKEISRNYTYKEYATVRDFEYAINNNKAIAGITSDHSIINLINDMKVAPISKEIKELNKLDKPWEEYFSLETVEQMKEYDQYILDSTQKKLQEKYKNYGSEYKFKFSDFVVPYFINDKLIAFDTKKLWNKVNLEQDPLGFGNKAPSIENVLQKIFLQSNAKMQWTKNEKENVVLGSTLNNPKENWNTEITELNYNTLISNFVSIVEKGTGYKASNTKRNLFENDSNVILNNLINPLSNINVATLYNGDALDAYYGNDNFKDQEDGDRVRIVRTNYTIRVLDAFVVSSSISENEKNKILKNFNDSFFMSMFLDNQELEKLYLDQKEKIYENVDILRIFDFVNYPPAAKGAYNFVYNNYFEADEIAKSIYRVSSTDETKGIYVKAIAPIEKNTLSKLTIEFQRKLNGF